VPAGRALGGDCCDDLGDAAGVGVADGDEVLRCGSVESGEQLGLRVPDHLGGEWDAVPVAFVDSRDLGDGGVQTGGISSPRESHIGALAGQPGWANDEDVVAGDALGFVDGDRIAMIDPTPVEVPAIEDDPVTGRGHDDHPAGGEVDDGPAHPVVDREGVAVGEVLARVVAAEYDVVTDGVVSSADLDLGGEVELAVCGEDVAGTSIEALCFGTSARKEQRGAGGAGGVPVGENESVEFLGGVGGDDPVVFEVGVECGLDVTGAELIERGTFPGVVLAAVDGEFDDSVSEDVEGGSERAAGGDFG
jgi:hypothetical protein